LFPPVRDGVLKADPAWQQFSYWAAIKRNGSRVTSYYYLRAFDLQRNVRDEVERTPRSEAIFVTVLGRTLWISLIVMLICLAIAYPLAYTMTAVGPSTANVMMTMLLIPLWTSLLVRSIAWVVLLQREGLVNDAFLRLGLFDERIRLVFNRTGLLIAMVHVLLPFMVLPIYSVMKGIGRQHMRAALSLGATPIRAFTSVYLPLSMPGVGAGCLLVFIIAVGYYITPELVGGGNDQMLSHFIAYYTNQALNWGQAAALAVVLLVVIALLYPIYARVSQPTAFLLK
jgi:putative spermidine/putrescine transport system permease protein